MILPNVAFTCFYKGPFCMYKTVQVWDKTNECVPWCLLFSNPSTYQFKKNHLIELFVLL